MGRLGIISVALWMGPLPTISAGYLRTQLGKLVDLQAIDDVTVQPGTANKPGRALVSLVDLRRAPGQLG